LIEEMGRIILVLSIFEDMIYFAYLSDIGEVNNTESTPNLPSGSCAS